jgi:Holliday junction resolvasome RuvABC endonuclease subunit
MRILAIDVGLRSLGWAHCDTAKGLCNSSAWTVGIVDLYQVVPKKKRTDYCLMAKRLVEALPEAQRADVVCIERQMQARMKQVATALRAFLWPRAVLVAPIVVKRFFGTSCGAYASNKKAGVQLCREIVCADVRTALLEMKAKQETDAADALLMVYWYWFQKLGKPVPDHVQSSRRKRGIVVGVV